MPSWIKIQLRLLLMKLDLITCATWHIVPAPATSMPAPELFGSYSSGATPIRPGTRPLPIP